jgi:hypothetical protein
MKWKDEQKSQKKKWELAKARSERAGESDEDGKSADAEQQSNLNAGSLFGLNGNRRQKNRS